MAMCFLKTGLSQEAEETGQTKSVFSRRTERWTGGGLRSCWRTCPLTPREGAKVLRGHAEGHAGGRLFVKERGRWRKAAAGLRATRGRPVWGWPMWGWPAGRATAPPLRPRASCALELQPGPRVQGVRESAEQA